MTLRVPFMALTPGPDDAVVRAGITRVIERGWFIRLALEGREIEIYGDGSQMRDFVYVDDVSDAFLRAGASDVTNGEAFNVGGTEPIAHRDLVKILIQEAGRGSSRFVPWPDEKRRIDIGSFYSDSTKFMRATGWTPTVDLRDGFAKTLAYYRDHFDRYISPPEGAGAS